MRYHSRECSSHIFIFCRGSSQSWRKGLPEAGINHIYRNFLRVHTAYQIHKFVSVLNRCPLPINVLFLLTDPKFAEPIVNVTVPVGREAILVCVVDDLSSFKVGKIILAYLREDDDEKVTQRDDATPTATRFFRFRFAIFHFKSFPLCAAPYTLLCLFHFLYSFAFGEIHFPSNTLQR